MEYAYLGSNVISLAVWAVLFWWRKDLRNMMLIMSVCTIPVAFVDLLFVPDYWMPVTMFDLPIGIEGFLYAFSAGGIAAALYAAFAKRRLRPISTPNKLHYQAIGLVLLTLTAFMIAYVIGVPNPEIAAYIALVIGVTTTLILRPDLARSALFGGVMYGIVYFFALKVWVTLFPEVHAWFTFDQLPQLFIWGVPGWEVVFGFFFGAYWTNFYEVLFGYKFEAK